MTHACDYDIPPTLALPNWFGLSYDSDFELLYGHLLTNLRNLSGNTLALPIAIFLKALFFVIFRNSVYDININVFGLTEQNCDVFTSLQLNRLLNKLICHNYVTKLNTLSFYNKYHCVQLQYSTVPYSRLDGVVVNMLTTGPKVWGFEPGQGDGFLRAIKICRTPCSRMGSKDGRSHVRFYSM
jgi:hypothetical protein